MIAMMPRQEATRLPSRVPVRYKSEPFRMGFDFHFLDGCQPLHLIETTAAYDSDPDSSAMFNQLQ